MKDTIIDTPAQAVLMSAVEPFIDKPEVGKRLAMRPRTVDDWMKRGLLPYYKVGRSVRFKWSEIESHLAATCRVSRRGN